MTLVELMVAMGITMVVLSSAYAVLSTTQRGVERQIDRQTSVDQVRLASEQIDREIRSAAFLTETDSGMGLRIYTLSNANTRGETCEEWRKTGSNLESRYWTIADVGSTIPWRVVATGIRNANTQPIFDVVTASPYDGRLVNVDLRVNSNPSGGDTNTQIQTSLTARNVPSAGVSPCDAGQPS